MRTLIRIFFPILIVPIYSCNPTKYVPENKQLLDKTKIEIKSGKVDKKELSGYIKQKPNKRVLGARFHLWVYNRSSKKRENGFNNWLRKIGEEPVIFDQLLTDKTTRQLQLYLSKKGFFLNEVQSCVSTKKKKARVKYYITPNNPFSIHEITYAIEDTGIQSLILADTINSLIKRKTNFDEDILQAERMRIERMMKERGYYRFSKEYIFYEADSSSIQQNVDIVVGIKQNLDVLGEQNVESPHKTYTIRNLYIYADYNTDKPMSIVDSISAGFDTIYMNEKVFYYPKDKNNRVKPQTLDQSIFMGKDNVYRLSDVEKTYIHLLSLKVYKYVNILFDVVKDSADSYQIDCTIQLSQLKNQSYTVEIEGTNSSGNIGTAGNIIYQHKNLFSGAEVFNVKFTGAMEALQESKIQDPEGGDVPNTDSRNFNNTLELGAEVSILIPRFLLPLKTEGFVKKFNPKTNISTAYNYHRRPEYTRTIANASFGYTWRGNKYTTHLINPIELNAVKIFDMNQTFYDSLPGPLKYSYEDHFVATTTYSFVFTNQNIKKNTDFYYIRINLESAGNLFTLYHNTFGPDSADIYTLFGMEYAQYIKGDIDFRYSHVLNQTDKMVYRVFAGVGFPYGNSLALPFEKKYFSGGANSIRAWQVRSLGPGSLYENISSRYANQSADIKLEANMEYRFDLFWVLKGAWFLDAGNIWEIIKDPEREAGYFSFDKFYYDIAVGTGLGMRFDFSFFIFRLDIGLKLRDPLLYGEGITNKWILSNRNFEGRDFTYNIGIGYPF